MEEVPAHTPNTEGELQQASANCFYDKLDFPDSPVPAGSAQLNVSCVSRVTTQPPSPASFSKISQFHGPASAGSL